MGAATNQNELLQRRLLKNHVQYAQQNLAKTTDKAWYMLVDLSNLSGKFPHTVRVNANHGIICYRARGEARAANVLDVYAVNFAVVLKLNGTASADLAVFSPAGYESGFPVGLDLTVNAGGTNLKNGYASVKAADTTVKSNVALLDPTGSSVLPEVGDVIYQVISNGNVAGAPTGDIEYAEASIWYDVR